MTSFAVAVVIGGGIVIDTLSLLVAMLSVDANSHDDGDADVKC